MHLHYTQSLGILVSPILNKILRIKMIKLILKGMLCLCCFKTSTVIAKQNEFQINPCFQHLNTQSVVNPGEIELKLLDHAKEKLKEIFTVDKHFVVAAILTKSGKIYTGFNFKTVATRASVCAESMALSKALEASEKELELMVVVACLDGNKETVIVTPCGICRELLYDYAPNIEIIVPVEEDIATISLKKLLILPYKR